MSQKPWHSVSIRVCLTGRVSPEVDGEVLLNESHLRGKQGRLIFGYLVSERIWPVTKEELATVVWEDDLSLAWEGALSVLTSRLRSHLLKALLVEKLGSTSLEAPASINWVCRRTFG